MLYIAINTNVLLNLLVSIKTIISLTISRKTKLLDFHRSKRNPLYESTLWKLSRIVVAT